MVALQFAKFWVGIFAICILFIPTLAYGSASKITYGVDAKWINNLNFMICISSIDKEHAELFIKAVDEWKARWDHFGYTLSYSSDCHINVYIVKTHPMLEEHGYLGYTELQYWNRGAIVKADIYLLTTKKVTIPSVVKGKLVTSELFQPLSNDEFYMAALHEFGHALNLGHFDDDGQEPVDIMYAHPAGDGKKQEISQTDIRALNWLYFRFLDQEVTVQTDKTSYKSGDTVRISGKVTPMIPGNIVRLDVLDQEKKLYRSETVDISRDGTFSDRVSLPSKGEAGFLEIKASYDGAVADASIDIIGPKST